MTFKSIQKYQKLKEMQFLPLGVVRSKDMHFVWGHRYRKHIVHHGDNEPRAACCVPKMNRKLTKNKIGVLHCLVFNIAPDTQAYFSDQKMYSILFIFIMSIPKISKEGAEINMTRPYA